MVSLASKAQRFAKVPQATPFAIPTPNGLSARHRARACRVRAGSAERGSALFMVVLVLALLSAIGMFSMRSASLVDTATGYNRQSIQAVNLAEYAARASATYIGRSPSFLRRAGSERVGGCAKAYLDANAQAGCIVVASGDALLAEFNRSAAQPIADGLAGLLSAADSPTRVQGNFVTELTAPGTATQRPGFASGQFMQVTFTAIATVYPTDDTASTSCDAGAVEALSRQAVRAHVIVPNL